MATPTIESEIEEIEQLTFNQSDSVEFPPSDMIAYNELRSCADLFRMFREGILEIQPDFQREIVWQGPAQTRFIDSLVKQLPIPSMCFSLDYKTQKWQVIDGLQRMWSIVRFLRGDSWRLSSLDDVDPSISGQFVPDFKDAKPSLRKYYDLIANLTLPVTVLRCDYSKRSHMEYLFTIFHRLNSGAARLNNQEIRNCIFSGSFNDFLKEVDGDQAWLRINGRSSTVGDRYRGQELLLRFFAFHDNYRQYKGGLAAFLNNYMREHREPGEGFLTDKKAIFSRSIRLVDNAVFKGRAEERRSISVMEATLVGIGLNLGHLEALPKERIREMYEELLKSEEFSDSKLREGLSGVPRVLGRMATAERTFSR